MLASQWRLLSLCWWFSQCIKLVTNILNRSPTSQTCHQHIWSPTSIIIARKCLKLQFQQVELIKLAGLIDFSSTYTISTHVKSIFDRFFGRNYITAVSNTHKISIKMFQIHQRICWEYSRNFRGLLHAKVKKSIFNRKILELVGDFGIILNDFQSWFHSAFKIWVKFIWVENPKIPGIQPNHQHRCNLSCWMNLVWCDWQNANERIGIKIRI